MLLAGEAGADKTDAHLGNIAHPKLGTSSRISHGNMEAIKEGNSCMQREVNSAAGLQTLLLKMLSQLSHSPERKNLLLLQKAFSPTHETFPNLLIPYLKACVADDTRLCLISCPVMVPQNPTKYPQPSCQQDVAHDHGTASATSLPCHRGSVCRAAACRRAGLSSHVAPASPESTKDQASKQTLHPFCF